MLESEATGHHGNVLHGSCGDTFGNCDVRVLGRWPAFSSLDLPMFGVAVLRRETMGA